MSQPEHRILNVGDHKAEKTQGSAHSQMAQDPEGKPEVADSSGPLFSMYCKMAEEDKKKIESWLKSVDKVVILMGLFSTSVAALLTVTVQDLRQSPQETANFYLENLYKLQFLADSNAPLPSTPAQPPPFSVPKFAIWVNSLLFMSLCLNIFTAILALSIRRILPQHLLRVESPRLSPHYRARIEEMITYELRRSRVRWAFAVMGFLSAVFFFVGLVVYLHNINRTVFIPVFCCSLLSLIIYCSVNFWLNDVPDRSKLSAKVDHLILKRLFKKLVEDSDFVQFFQTVPGFCRSSVVLDPISKVTKLGKEKLCTGVKGLLERTWSSKFFSIPEKMRRLVVCVNFADAIRLSDVALPILQDIFPQDQHDVLQSVEMGKSLRSPVTSVEQEVGKEQEIGLCAQTIVAGIVSNVQESNDDWVALAADQFGKSKDVIRGYLRHGNDNVLLANLTHITRQIFHSLTDNRDMAASSSTVLPSLSKFDIRNTLPELQDSFRSLWDEIEHAPTDELVMDIRDSLLNLHNSLSQAQGDNIALISTASSTAAPDTGPSGNPSSSTSPVPQAIDVKVETHATSSSDHDHSFATTSPHISPSPAGNNVANNPPRETPTVRDNLDSAPPAMVTTLHSSTTPMAAASLYRSHVAGAAPLVGNHDPQDLSDPPVELELLNHTRWS
ncbi:hypothetical protein BGW80DRAFT_1341226 [Lactifluus volemus]|nr:hypothetical protein BGW80DRAFT_1341226 [Lactifluus volemus]